MRGRVLGVAACLALCALGDLAAARTKIEIDVDLRGDRRPHHTRFRRVRRYGWHSGLHYGPYTDPRGRRRVGWHRGQHRDWYTIDLPVLDRIDKDDWHLFVRFGKDKTLRIRGDANRRVTRVTTAAVPRGSVVGWLGPEGGVIAGGPATGLHKRFLGNGWQGFDLGDSIIMLDLPRSRGVEVYLKRRTKNLVRSDKAPPPKTPAEQIDREEARRERDRLLDRGDRLFARGLYPRAALLYQKAMALDRTDAVARFAVAHALFALGVYRTAGENLRLALDRFPDWPLVHLELPKFYQNGAIFSRKLAALERYVAEHPRDDDARLLLGYCYFFSGNRKAGLARFQRLVRQPGGDRHAELFVNLMKYQAVLRKPTRRK